MYHYDGHRACNIRLTPTETKKNHGLCPVCKRPLTVGVMNRVDELADRPLGFKPAGTPGFIKLVELDKIIAESLGVKSRNSTKVQTEYNQLIKHFGNELKILMDVPIDDLGKATLPKIAEGIKRVREGKLIIGPGYDGQYGVVKIFNDDEVKDKQKSLF